MSDEERSYGDGYAAGYAKGFVEASLPSARQPVFEFKLCICGVMSGGARSPNPTCPVHEGSMRHVR